MTTANHSEERIPLEDTAMVDVEAIKLPDIYSFAYLPDEKIAELRKSIEKQGIRSPLALVEIEGQLCLADGYHRWMIARDLGMTRVPCRITKGTSRELRIQNLTLNKNRGKYDPIGNSKVLAALVKEDGMRVEDAAERCGMSASWARRLLSLQRLPETIQEDIKTGKLSASHGMTLLIFKEPENIEKLREEHRLTEEQALQAADEQILDLADWCKINSWNRDVLETMLRQRLGLALTPQQEKIEFTETGEVVDKRLTCECCGLPCEGEAVYAWYHPNCRNQVRLMIKELEALGSQPETRPPSQVNPEPYVSPGSVTANPHTATQQQPWQQHWLVCPQCGSQMQEFPLGARCPQCGNFQRK